MAKNVTKADLVSLIAKDTGLTKANSEAALKSAIANVVKSVSKGNRVTLVGFGTFSSAKRAARTGRNPQTGAKMKIPAKTVPKFSAGKGLRDAVAGKKKKK